jgi:hypothetical protein
MALSGKGKEMQTVREMMDNYARINRKLYAPETNLKETGRYLLANTQIKPEMPAPQIWSYNTKVECTFTYGNVAQGYSQPKKVTFQSIVKLVLDETRIDHREIWSQRRSPYLTHARFVIWALAKHFTELSFPTMGRLSKRCHTTVLHGVRNGVKLPLYEKLKKQIE